VVDTTIKRNEWWDRDCEKVKKEKMYMLRKYRQDRSDVNLRMYVKCRNDFKLICSRKKRVKEQILQNRIRESLSDTSKCWKTLKSLSLHSHRKCNISGETWCEYFKDLLNIHADVDVGHRNSIKSSLLRHSDNCDLCVVNNPLCLNSNFTYQEISDVLRTFACNKAAGPDGVVMEMLKAGKDILLPLFILLFNLILKDGNFPAEWSKAMLIPLYKKGSVNDVNNYRGIALLNVIGKLFTKCLTVRLTKYYVNEDLLFEEQAGFRVGRSTVDQLFTLQTCVTMYLSRQGGRVYCAFIDFSKAFDSVSHDHLFFKLIKDGVHGDFLSSYVNEFKT